jgi:hypothetical protein
VKICTKCLLDKPESDFYFKDKRTGRLHAQCKDCYSLHRRTYYAAHYEKYKTEYLKRAKARRLAIRTDIQQRMLKYLSDKACEICGEADVRVLEFDHLDPAEKRFSISQGRRLGFKWEEISKEIESCRILCANCHKRHTAKQYNWYKA